jgi:hypothetical protein
LTKYLKGFILFLCDLGRSPRGAAYGGNIMKKVYFFQELDEQVQEMIQTIGLITEAQLDALSTKVSQKLSDDEKFQQHMRAVYLRTALEEKRVEDLE